MNNLRDELEKLDLLENKKKFLKNKVDSIQDEKDLDNLLDFLRDKPANIKDVMVSILKLVGEFKVLFTVLAVFLILGSSVNSIKKGLHKSQKRLGEKIQENIKSASPKKTEERLNRVRSYLSFLEPYYVEFKRFDQKTSNEAKSLLEN